MQEQLFLFFFIVCRLLNVYVFFYRYVVPDGTGFVPDELNLPPFFPIAIGTGWEWGGGNWGKVG